MHPAAHKRARNSADEAEDHPETEAAGTEDGGGQVSPLDDAEGEGRVLYTPTVEQGLASLNERKQQVDFQLEELTAEAVKFLDDLKQSFLDKMTRVRTELNTYCEAQQRSWTELSAETKEAEAKRDQARALVEGLSSAAFEPRH